MPTLPPNPVIYYGLLAFCLLLGIGLLALAWQRPRQRQRLLRMLAGAMAVGALWFTAFPPLRPLPAARAEAILLTEGYAPDTLRQLLRQLGAGTPVWAYGEVEMPDKAKPLASLLTLAEQRPALRRLHLLGQGLPAVTSRVLSRGAEFRGRQTCLRVEKERIVAKSTATPGLQQDPALPDTLGDAG